ncbi:MAG: FAD-dependent monooxygenase [Candidatus Acidiferrales bacterium]
MASSADVLIVGAGPAGIATAIAAAQQGLRATVADARRPPLDKACGEGLLPEGVSALQDLGIRLDSSVAFPFAGLRFSDEASSASGRITRGAAFGLRRSVLHDLLVRRAAQLGISFHWGTHVSELTSTGALLDGVHFPFRYLVGADGQKSVVRKWADLGARSGRSARFGFRCHFAVAPWSEFVEVHWGERCQLYITPTGPAEICVALLTSDPRQRIELALQQFPAVANRLRGAQRLTAELGSPTGLERPRHVARGRIALVGDASFTIDGITGRGLSLAFQQALRLGEALASENLAQYQLAHRRIVQGTVRAARLLLLLDRHAWLRRKALRTFAQSPALFTRLISSHASHPRTAPIGTSEIFGLGWQFLRA